MRADMQANRQPGAGFNPTDRKARQGGMFAAAAAIAARPDFPPLSGYRVTECRGALAVLFWVMVVLVAAGPVFAEPVFAPRTTNPVDPAELCDLAAARAARETGVPLAVLRAISLTETGRRHEGRLRPWPWTVNMEGAGRWFDTEDEAKDYVERNHGRGARSYDVGCFQLNYRWHGQHFASPEAMFDPLENARYAARFLARLYAETGDWGRAAGAYHSRTPRYANRYRDRFATILARLEGAPQIAPGTAGTDTAEGETVVAAAPPPPEPDLPRINTFPLLQAAAEPAGLGSLVPLAVLPGPRLIEPGAAPLAEDGDAG